MKITILGSGHGVPEAHKQCTSILFEVSGSYYFVDAGCDISMELANRRIHPNAVKAIIPQMMFIFNALPVLKCAVQQGTANSCVEYISYISCLQKRTMA